MKRLSVLFLTLCILLTGCAGSYCETRAAFAMDTDILVTAYGSRFTVGGAIDRALAVLNEADTRLSAVDTGSELYRLNETGAAELSDATAALLARALTLADATGGAFDPTVYPCVQAWGFTSTDKRVPDADELLTLRAYGSYSDVTLDGNTAVLRAGMALDFGGIAKGYTADVMANALRDAGVTSAVISLGGNVRAVGSKPDGSPWRIGLRNPYSLDASFAVVQVMDCSVVTSGSYQRYFERDGVTYHHILDPSTGAPARTGLVSVTVIGSDGALADAYATALFVMGLDDALKFQKTQGDFEAVFVTENREIVATSGLAGVLSDISSDYTLRYAG
ncbi:MAG: FAD:protein FMN transferase [Eubacteriales bacterium]|jgi:thiamine biosynthesis lipoprotein